jgi:hypothetical protein
LFHFSVRLAWESIGAERRIGQLKLLIIASRQAGTEICQEPRQHGQGIDSAACSKSCSLRPSCVHS